MLRARLPVLVVIAAVLALAAPAPADPGKGHGQAGGQSKASGQGQGDGHGQGRLAPVATAAASGPGPSSPADSASPASVATGPGKGHGPGKVKHAEARAVQPAAAPDTAVPAANDGRGSGKPAKATAAAAKSQPVVATPAAAPAAAVPVAAAPVAAPPATKPSASPVVRKPARRRAGRVVVSRRRTVPHALPSGASGPAPAAVVVPAAARATPVASHRTPRAHAKPAPRPARASQPALPIVRTVDRILRVIPGWIELLLAGAAACGLLLAGAALLQTRRARRLEDDRRRLAADVGLLQAALLPPLPPRIAGTRVSAAYRPAEGLAAGGDFFDIFALAGGRTALILGDMAGHGREIVPFTALVRYSLRAYLEAGLEPRIALQLAGAALEPQLGGHLVTATVAVFDPGDGLLTYACAGHAQPLLAPDALAPVVAASSPPIGAGYPTGRRQTTLPLAAGWGACFWTDGVADVRVGEHRLGPDALAALRHSLGPEADADALLAAVVQASDSQPDDMAVCLLAPRRAPRSAAAASTFEELELDDHMLADGRAQRFLAACAVEPHEAAAVMRTAGEHIGRAGSAVLEVRRTRAGAEVHVRSPRVAMLPVARREHGSAPLALAAARA